MKTLENIFLTNKDKKHIFVQPGGNWGDYLIYFGLECLAKKINLSYETYKINEFFDYTPKPNEVIYIHGGGAFNSWSTDAGFRALKHAINSDALDVIYGPCTCSQDVEFLEGKFGEIINAKRKFTLFARELTTYSIFNNLNCLKGSAEVLLDNDTAFHSTKAALQVLAGEEKYNYSLYGYRSDKEDSGITFVPTPQFLLVDPPEIAKSFAHWVRIHLHAKEIVTNRTHSSIVGSILGKPTTLFDNSYHKNRSIWQYNLEARGVKWIEASEAIKIVEPKGLARLIPKKLNTSWKLNTLFRRLKGFPQC